MREADEATRHAIGQRIRTLRELLDMTQGALAAKVHVTQPAVSQWESGQTLPTLPLQFTVADALRTTRSRLFRELEASEAGAA